MEQVEHGAEAVPYGDAGPATRETAASRRRLASLRGAWERLVASTLDNPVLVKEFRTRMRGTRAYWILLGYTLLIAAILGFAYFLHEQSLRAAGAQPNAQSAQQLGRVMYYIVFITQALLVALITPAITAGAITIEREQRSYELLVTTPLRAVDLIQGKLTAAVSFVVLLLTASLPLASLTFLVGGVSPAEIFFSYLLIALGAYVAGAIGIFWSATLRSTAVATVITYITVGALFLMSLVPGIIASEVGAGTGARPEIPFQSLNPIMGVFRAVQPEHFFQWQFPSWISASVILTLFGTLIASQGLARLEHFERPNPLWPRVCATLLWTAACAFLLGPPVGELLKNAARTTAGNEVAGIGLLLGLGMLLMVVPIWNTGDLVLKRDQNALRRYLGGLLPHRLFGDDLPNGLPLTVLWVAIFAVTMPLGILTAGQPKLLLQNDVLLPGLTLLACVALGLAGVGNLISVSVPSRWAAGILTYLVIVAFMMLPYFALAPWVAFQEPRPAAVWSLLYLVPSEGIAELVQDNGFWSTRSPLPIRPLWLVSSLLYAGMGLLCFLLTAYRVGRAGKKLQSPAPQRAAEPAGAAP